MNLYLFIYLFIPDNNLFMNRLFIGYVKKMYALKRNT